MPTSDGLGLLVAIFGAIWLLILLTGVTICDTADKIREQIERIADQGEYMEDDRK